MKTSPPGGPPHDVESAGEEMLPADGDSARSANQPSELSYLVQLQQEFEADLGRFEAAFDRGPDSNPRLYERLLRARRIFSKLDNRIQFVRREQKLRTG